jgi:hypothetical protein
MAKNWGNLFQEFFAPGIKQKAASAGNLFPQSTDGFTEGFVTKKLGKILRNKIGEFDSKCGFLFNLKYIFYDYKFYYYIYF